MDYDPVRAEDPELGEILTKELNRQRDSLQMIASENHVSQTVLKAQGSVMANKYAEGLPGTRWYGGCEYADELEELAIDRAKELWGAEHVNIQPHSGTQANEAVYLAALDPGDKILALDQNQGAHSSHGHQAYSAGQFYEVEQYGIDVDTGHVDYEGLREHAEAFEPDLIISGYSMHPHIVDWERVQDIAEDVDAYHLADIAHINGLVAGGVHPNPVGIADFVTGSTHKTIRAGRGGIIMCDEEHASDVDSAVSPGSQGGPHMHCIAGKAAGFKEALSPEFEEYAQQVVDNAQAFSDRLQEQGISVFSGGTEVHMVLVDLEETHPDLSGLDAEEIFEDANIVLNAQRVPGESNPDTWNPQGIRFGTPALTTRGFDEEDLRAVADLVVRVLDAPDDESVRESVREEVQVLCDENPLYEDLL
ncbi:serine hydroxymethyltransferase [Natronorubrum sp. FCH18a]|uniref:serine hydroxymethyltransferase n=1 Tax=Natronorubrum sp. FCH18a TaxID=3447018 RepID=UPI003F511C6C